jgi:hypothetical protein
MSEQRLLERTAARLASRVEAVGARAGRPAAVALSRSAAARRLGTLISL